MGEPPRDPKPAAPRDPSLERTEAVRLDADATVRMPSPEPTVVTPVAAAAEPVVPPAAPSGPAARPEAPEPATTEEPEAAAEEPAAPAEPGRGQAVPRSPWPFLGLLGGALVLLLLVLSLLARGGGDETAGKASTPAGAPALPQVRVLAVVRDLPGELEILSDERVRGLDPIGEPEQRRVARAVTAGELSPAPDAAALRGGAEMLPPDAPLRPLAPVATRVVDERPLLRWTPAVEPAAYVVTVVDASGQVLVTSPPLGATEWRPPRALPSRRGLGWFVEARPRGRGAEPLRSTLARFAVLGGDERAWLEREIEAGGRSLLLAAVLNAEVGAFDDARAALDELIKANPGSGELARLREVLRPEGAP